MQWQYVLKDGKLYRPEDLRIPLDAIQFQYGFGVYETLKVRNKILYFAHQHITRLLQSAKLIGLEHQFAEEQITAYIQEVIAGNTIESANIKMLLYGGKTAADSSLFLFPTSPLFPDRKLYSQGASVETVQYQRFMPQAKTLSMLPSYLFFTKASKRGQYDVLFLGKDDAILEGSRTNFFVIKEKTLVTPPLVNVLDGVTRQTVISVAKRNGFAVVERSISLHSLADFDGAFLTSTSSKIIPLIQIDKFRFSTISPQLKELMKIYDAFLDECNGIFV